ncbi:MULTISPECIES: hypothetical protein [Ralstonia]|uniref:hypothetical protein n=1 Tax=Ralstonia TaxID=48736 RepID=UPI000C79F28C|nr:MULTISPECIES: hypothetical protein [Ralstonia]PLT19462.1 hypothetical protein CXP34_05715 [Ralstonia mannitolilytica]
MQKVTKADLDIALQAWKEARESAAQEQLAWADLNGSHKSLIESLMSHGHSWPQADAEFQRLQSSHQQRLLGHWKAMDDRCAEYYVLLERFKRGE